MPRRRESAAGAPAMPSAEANSPGDVPVLVRLPDLGALLDRIPRRDSDPPPPAPTQKVAASVAPAAKPPAANVEPESKPRPKEPVDVPRRERERERRPRPEPQPSSMSSVFNKVLGVGLIVGLIATAYLLLSGKSDPSPNEPEPAWPPTKTETTATPPEHPAVTPNKPDEPQTAITQPVSPMTPSEPAPPVAVPEPTREPQYPDGPIAREVQAPVDNVPNEAVRPNDAFPPSTQEFTTQPYEYPNTNLPPYPYEAMLPNAATETAAEAPYARTGRREVSRYGGDSAYPESETGAGRLQGTIETPQVKPRYEQPGSSLY